jgi:hypothetical protein
MWQYYTCENMDRSISEGTKFASEFQRTWWWQSRPKHVVVKVKLSLYRPLGLREVEASTFSDIRVIDGGEVVSFTRFLPPGRFLVIISVGGWVDPRAMVRLEGLGKLEKSTPSGIGTGDLPTCSIVPQPTTLPRAPETCSVVTNFKRI